MQLEVLLFAASMLLLLAAGWMFKQMEKHAKAYTLLVRQLRIFEYQLDQTQKELEEVKRKQFNADNRIIEVT